jgi:hypothetical protein
MFFRDLDIKIIVLAGCAAVACLIWYVSPWLRIGGVPDEAVIYFDVTIGDAEPEIEIPDQPPPAQ